jgi:hypothetical protein
VIGYDGYDGYDGFGWWSAVGMLLLAALLPATRATATQFAAFVDPETGDPLPGNAISLAFQDNRSVSPGTYILSAAGYGEVGVDGENLRAFSLGETFFSATEPFVPSISVAFNTPIVGLLDGNGRTLEIVQAIDMPNFRMSVADGSIVISSITSTDPAGGVSILFEPGGDPILLRVRAPGVVLPDSDFGVWVSLDRSGALGCARVRNRSGDRGGRSPGSMR